MKTKPSDKILVTALIALFIVCALWIRAEMKYVDQRLVSIERGRKIEILLDELDYCYGSEIYYYQPQMIRIKPE